MKRKIVILIASILLLGSMQAQENHYNVTDIHAFQTHMLVVAQIYLNGVEQSSSNIEIGAFVGDEVRGSDRVGPHTSHNYNRAHIDVYYTNTGESVQFRLYDHSTNTEYLSYSISVECLTRQDGYGTNKYPVVFNFSAPFTKEIAAYTENGGYYLIASPIGQVNPENVSNMVSNSFDLYRFNQNASLEWENWEAESTTNYHFSLEPGKGYLYANSENVTLTFAGTPYSGSGEIVLDYIQGAALTGWNLIGNPYANNAIVNKPYYRLNEAGSALKTSTEETYVEAMEGIFVQATETNQTATFTPQRSKAGQHAIALTNIVVSNSKGIVLDNAIIRFDKGQILGKFQLNENSTKVYIRQEGQDYAIVNADEMGEIPIGFKAENNGSYTLSFTNKEVSYCYLHLIDNLTGNNIDLLQTPTYTFNALTTDYASRFKLVFAIDGSSSLSAGSETFAFINDMGNLCIIGAENSATLQLIDILGHMIHSEQFSGNYESKLNAAPGIYMLRLIQGEDVKVQKIIVN